MEDFLIGLVIGLVIGASIIGIMWNETLYDENDQKIKK
jgi:hypothetical protein